MNPKQAAEFIASKVPGIAAEALLADPQLFEMAVKLAQRKLHPDSGGTHEDFVKLQEAVSVLVESGKEQQKAAKAS